MGIADAVPGVSGGTVAFITGIYPRLIQSLSACNIQAIRCLFTQGIWATFSLIDARFLLVLLAGILTSVVLFAHVIGYLLDQWPLLVWAFFSGLVLASAGFVVKQSGIKSPAMIGWVVLGALLCLGLSSFEPNTAEQVTPMVVFLAGIVAITAMILPGISGSFILLLLGLYQPILQAVRTFDVVIVVSFAFGCVMGLLLFVRLIAFALNRWYKSIVSLLVGFLLGSMYLLWPWKIAVNANVVLQGKSSIVYSERVWPSTYRLLSGHDPMLVECALVFCFAVVCVFFIERGAKV